MARLDSLVALDELVSEVDGLRALEALDAHERGLPTDGWFDPESTLGKWARGVRQSQENRSLELRNIMERMDGGGGGSIDVLPLACTCPPRLYKRQPWEARLPPVPDLPPLAVGRSWGVYLWLLAAWLWLLLARDSLVNMF